MPILPMDRKWNRFKETLHIEFPYRFPVRFLAPPAYDVRWITMCMRNIQESAV